ncbi:hypothetical protein GCM10027169_35830 [Gordonia jinhuaensis]|uniref:Secreted protein n=1 Tax=Gordonia jinhuaensis TaxID=1517702 RepID=A0A916T3J1_9ACTN|nr:hypothetical protein [Gordonia jinhuaensis]GGB29677.1 hypothetical protein GCM10011489_17300 [Gordonia jinhuaensis]
MVKPTRRISIVLGGVAIALLSTAPIASADHVNVPKPPTPPWSRTADGLTYCFVGHCESWDKLNNYVCQTGVPTGPVCDVIMAAVRALPPVDVGNFVPHNIIP